MRVALAAAVSLATAAAACRTTENSAAVTLPSATPLASTAVPPAAPPAATTTSWLLKPGPPKAPLPRGFPATDDVHFVGLDQTHAFYTDSRGVLWASPKDGSAPAVAIGDHALTFVVEPTTITYASDHSLVRVDKTGGPKTTLVTEHEDPVSLVSDGTWFFYSLFDGAPIRRLPVGGGSSTTIHPGIKSGALAVDDAWLYVADYATSSISRVRKTGGTVTPIANAPHPVGIVVDEGFVYVTCEPDGSVRRYAKSGGPAQILAVGAHNHDEPVVDASYVYWTSGGSDMALFRVKKDGAAKPEIVHAGLTTNPNQIAIDERHYFVTSHEGVLVLPR
jgi:hypothetical protein